MSNEQLNLNDLLKQIAEDVNNHPECNTVILFDESIDNNTKVEDKEHQLSMLLSLMVKKVVFVQFKKPIDDFKSGDVGYFYNKELPTANIKFIDGKATVEEVKSDEPK